MDKNEKPSLGDEVDLMSLSGRPPAIGALLCYTYYIYCMWTSYRPVHVHSPYIRTYTLRVLHILDVDVLSSSTCTQPLHTYVDHSIYNTCINSVTIQRFTNTHTNETCKWDTSTLRVLHILDVDVLLSSTCTQPLC